jgi:TRAP-type uncharacterized transport system substrate-binding protein
MAPMYIGKVSPVFVRAHEKIVPIPIAIISWNTADGVDIPFHSGAAAYYTERGINVLTE